MFVFFLEKNEQQLTILCDVAVNGVASYFNAMQGGARSRRDIRTRADTGGHVQTLAVIIGLWGRRWGGWKAASRGHGACFCRAIMDLCVHVLANPDATHGNAHGVTRVRARGVEPCRNST